MGNIKLDIPDITVVVEKGTEYLSTVTPSEIYQILVNTGDNYNVVVDDAATITVNGSGSYLTVADYASTASYALFAQSLVAGGAVVYDTISSSNAYFGNLTVSQSITANLFTGSFRGDGSQLTGVGVSGGTNKYIPLWTGTNTISSSLLFQTGSSLLLGATTQHTPEAPDRFGVFAGVTDSYNLISAHGETDQYLQLNVKNFSGGQTASSDVVATADMGDEFGGYIDFGINSSNYAVVDGIGGPLDAYLYSTGSDLLIGNTSPDKRIILFTGGGNAANNARVYIDASGSVGINTSQPTIDNPEALVVDALTNSYNLITARANVDNYSQINIKNLSGGNSASADIVATANNGTEISNYIDMGINSDQYNQPNLVGGPNDAYLYSTGNMLHIGNATEGQHIMFFAGGVDAAANNKLTLDANNQHTLSGSLNVTGSVNVLNGVINNLTASFAMTASYVSGAASTWDTITNKPTGLVSSSVQINTGSFSGSFTGTLIGTASWATSASYVLPSGLPTGTVSSSTQVSYTGLSNVPANIVSGSTQIVALGFATTGSNSFNGNQTITGSLIQGLEGNIATGENSHAEGSITKAIGNYSHAEGDNTQAIGDYSHAEGQETIASGSYSHAEGYQTIALANHQHVQGQYNAVSSVPAAFIVGNGTDDSNRSNLIYAAGNEVQITGSLKVTTGITGSLFGTSSQAVTASYILSTGLPTGTVSSSTQASTWTVATASIATSASYAITASAATSITFTPSTASFATTASAATSITFIPQSSSFATTASYVLPSGLPSGVVSSSSQVSYTGLSNVPSGIVSSSSQINTGSFTGSFTGTHSGSIFGTASWASNAITASFAVTASYVSGAASTWDTIANKPSGLVSSSSQINTGSFTGSFTGTLIGTASWATNAISASAATSITFTPATASYVLPSGLPVGTISSSTQVSYTSLQNIPIGIVSSSTQINTGSFSGSFVGTLTGTSSWATNAITASYILPTGLPNGVISSSAQTVASIANQNVTLGIVTSSQLLVQGNLTVLGSSSIQYVTSSQVNIGNNKIVLNASTPAVQFGGISVIDSGSGQATGSLYWDSLNNRWVYQRESGAAYNSAIIIAGPKNTGSLGSESGLTTNKIPVATGDDHIGDSQITDNGTTVSITNNLSVGGSITASNGTATTISASNITNGIPTSNAWQTSLNGSYFNNFTSNTNVSEILRFVAGLLSASAPDAAPNTKTFSTITANQVNTTTGTVTAGSVPSASSNPTINYLRSKGFAQTGSTIFAGIGTIYTATNYGYTYTSVAAGSTSVSSSVDAQLFGLGQLAGGVPTTFNVSGSFTFKFKDNSTKTDTATSASQQLITQTGAGTTSGVTLAKINTVNPAVIPAAYQDGKFAAAFAPSLYTGSATTVSSSGYVHISASISIASGSGLYNTPIASNNEIFWAPLATISTNIPAQTPTVTGSVVVLTATSRSLSGAPYLSGSTYSLSGSVTGAFNPLYFVGNIATTANSGVGLSGTTTVTTNASGVATANAVYDSTGVTARATSTIPFETDVIKINQLVTFAASTNTNIAQSTITPTTFTITTSGLNKNGTATTSVQTVNYHTAGTFGQPVSSGSMAYWGRNQGTDTSPSGSSTSVAESFLGENHRIQLTDNILSFTGTAWNTGSVFYNLGANDLQVKPGYLVTPGGSYGYWITNPSSASVYKYYVRRFQVSPAATKTSMTLNLGRTLVDWQTATTDTVSVLILFESSNSSIYTPARLYDPTKTTSNFVTNIAANTDGQNPFGSQIALYGNSGGSLATTTYTIPIRNADGMFLNATYDEIYVLVRYNGNPVPVSAMTVTFS